MAISGQVEVSNNKRNPIIEWDTPGQNSTIQAHTGSVPKAG